MKKVISLMLCLCLMFGVSGCAKKTPSDTCEKMFRAVSKKDVTTISKLYAGDISDFSFADTQDLEGVQKKIRDELVKKALDFDYEILDEEIPEDGNTAYVTVKFTSYNLAGVMTDTMTEYIAEVFKMMLSSSNQYNEYDAEELLEEIFTEKMNACLKDYESTLDIKLEKSENGEWRISALKEQKDLQKAMLGGTLEGISSWLQGFAE